MIKRFFKKERVKEIIRTYFAPDLIEKISLRKAIYSACKRYLRGDFLLDIGCGDKPYYKIVSKFIKKYIGLDVSTSTGIHSSAKRVDVFYNGKNFPFEKETFDAVLCTQVLEYIPDLLIFLRKVNTILKSRAKLIITVPMIWDTYTESKLSKDYWRFTKSGLRYIFEQAGFETLYIKGRTNFLGTIGQAINCYIWDYLFRWIKNQWLKLPLRILVVFIGYLFYAFDKLFLVNDSFTTGFIIVCQKMKHYGNNEIN